MKKFLSVFLTTWFVWIMLAGFDVIEIIAGGLASLVLAYVLVNVLDFDFGLSIIPKGLKFIFVYLPVFILELVKANVDIAARVLNPSLPLNPGFVRVPTKIKGDFGKLTLANSITLTPGTLSIDVSEDSVYIHWVDVKGKSNDDYQKNVSGSFEKILGGIFK